MAGSAHRHAVLAGHRRDEPAARRLLGDPDPEVRSAALGALGRMQAVTPADVARMLGDTDVGVRRRACEAGASVARCDLSPALHDPEPTVVEVAAWALGELGAAEAVPDLAHIAGHHDDALCREAAVAALGAIGDRAGLPAILAATRDRPAVRRRAIIALAPFDGPDVDAALARALDDRDWQVRQAAEDLRSAE